jgi:hypothetical protein
MSVTTKAQVEAFMAEIVLKNPTAVFDESTYGYLRLKEPRPNNLFYQRVATSYFRATSKRHNLYFDGYDEYGFPCFLHEVD